jgi:serine/threonine protein kinase
MNREKEIFEQALDLASAAERQAFLKGACGPDAAMCERLQALLRSHEEAADFLPAQPAAPSGTVIVPITEKPGDRIGRYKLLQQIGEGGCGVVYMAEQEEPVRRRVALKVIKLGMDTKQVVARFEAERQALAMMEHPNIAKVLDAGATTTGRPYFVMELVRGTRITDFCDEKKLPTPERLDLFMQVCTAIQHAHQKGIIHRDLKPSNVLVTMIDGVPVPKVIDFGIAKATNQQRLTDKTLFTAFEQFIGTPAYMSPEQAEMSGVDIDTRSDIYSLGVLLYELLTGTTPFDAEQLLRSGLDGIRKTLREQEPLKPSTRLNTLAAADLTTVANQRHTEAPKLLNTVRGDLDWIVMKALEKDRARRYESASAFAQDVQRHVKNEAVLACPPSASYLFWKWAGRNQSAFMVLATVTACIVTMTLGLSVNTYRARQAQRVAEAARGSAEQANQKTQAALKMVETSEANATQERDEALKQKQRADEEAAIAKAVNDFLQNDLLRQASSTAQADAKFDPDPDLTVRQALDRASDQIGQRFTNQPLVEAAIRMAIGHAYLAIGEARKAIEHLEKSLASRKTRLEQDHSGTLYSMTSLAGAYHNAGKLDQALPLFEETLKLQKAKLGLEHPDTIASMHNLAVAYTTAGKLDQALPLHEEAFKLMNAKLGPEHPNTLISMNSLAGAYKAVGKLDQALSLHEETLKLRKAKLGLEHPDTHTSLNNLALAYKDAGKLDQAILLAEETLKVRKATLGIEHPHTLAAMNNLAAAYEAAGKLGQALPLYEETLKLRKSKLGLEHPDTLNSMNNLGLAYQFAGKPNQALSLYEETLKLRKATLGTKHPDTLTTMAVFGSACAVAKRYTQAEALLVEAQTGLGRPELQILVGVRISLHKTLRQLVELYTAWGKPDKATEWQAKLDEFNKSTPPESK